MDRKDKFTSKPGEMTFTPPKKSNGNKKPAAPKKGKK